MARGETSASRLPDLRGPVTAPAGGIRQVQLSAAAAATVRCEAARSQDGNETGGILLGQLHGGGIAEVRCAGGPGPVAVRQPTFFLRDLDHAQHLADEAFTRDGCVWIGEWHTHPATAPTPSDRDLATYARLLADPELSFEAFVSIIVAGERDWRHPIAHAWACYPDRAESIPIVLGTQRTAAHTSRTEDS